MDRLEDVAQWNRHLSFFGLSALALTNHHFSPLASRVTFSVLVCLLFLVLFCFQVIYSTKVQDKHVGYIVMKGYLVFGSNIVSLLIVVSALLCSNDTAQLLHMFLRLKCSCRSMITTRRLVTKMFIFLILSLALDFTQFTFSTESKFMVVINTLSIHLSLLYILLHIYHFSVCLYWLQDSLNILNTSLASVVQQYTNPRPLVNNKVTSKTLLDIRQWRKLFHNLVIINNKLNNIFAFRHIVTVGHNFVLGTLFAYGALSEIVTLSTPIQVREVIELAVQLKWAALSFASIYALIWPSRLSVAASVGTVEAVHSVLSTPLPTDIRDELHNFALQFLHGEVSISPHGFFRLNNKLLLSIIGALLSYLVVLIQFRVSSFL